MQFQSIAECSLGAFCNTFDLHYVIIGLDKKVFSFVINGLDKTSFCLLLSGLLRQVLLYTIKFNGYPF